MAYGQSSVNCDGEHSGYGNNGEITDGEEVFCEECVEALRERIKELEGELDDKKGEIESLEQQLADAEAKVV